MLSKTEICNMAISHLGIGKEIADLDTEKSSEAGACRRFYDVARDSSLRGFNWPFARQFSTLNLITDNTTQIDSTSSYLPEWNYYYAVPSGCLSIHRVLSGARNDSRQSRVPYILVQTQSGPQIYTDQINAQIEYTSQLTDTSLYPPDFVMAFSFLLASYIAPRITGGDNFQIGKMALEQYLSAISMAKAKALNEEQVDMDPESEFIRARGGYELNQFGNRFTGNQYWGQGYP